MSSSLSPTAGSSRARVPLEHRFLGLDKRSFPYALFVIAVFLIAAVIIPLINRLIPWDDPTTAGERLALSKTIGFTPTSGWNVESGFKMTGVPAPQSGEVTLVSSEGVTFDIEPGSFDGTPAQLIDQVAKVTSATDDSTFTVDGRPIAISSSSGDVGVIQPYSTIRGDGLIAAFVIDGTGLKITAYGPPQQLAAAAPDIANMIASIRSYAS